VSSSSPTDPRSPGRARQCRRLLLPIHAATR
jgi:hypothetical protein